MSGSDYLSTILKIKKLIKADRFLLAYNHLLQISERFPKKLEPVKLIINLIYGNKNFKNETIIEWIEKGLEIEPGDLDLLFKLGNLYLWEGKYKNAIEYFDRIPLDFPEKLFNKAIAHKYLAEITKAVEELEKCIRMYKKFINSYLFLLEIFMDFSLFNRAEIVIDQALTNFPKNSKLLYYAGIIKLNKKEWKDAWKYFNEAQNAGYDQSVIFRIKGNICAQYINIKQGIKYLEKSLNIDKNNEETYFDLLKLYKKNNEEDKYVELVKQALVRFPNNSLFNILINEHGK